MLSSNAGAGQGEPARRSRLRAAVVLLAGAAAVAAMGCGHDEPLGRGSGDGPEQTSPRGVPGAAIAVKGERLESGFSRGRLRKTVDVEPFRISKHPVTLREFRSCVSAGACEMPHASACSDWPGQQVTRRPNLHLEGVADDVPVTCAGLGGARRYCAWVGGRLPTLEQWLLAARGPNPQRYAWGSSSANCAQHPLAFSEGRSCSEATADVGRIGRHSAGASPGGLEDVLLTRGELLDKSEEALFPACRTAPGGKNSRGAQVESACIVYGLEPGAIDSVRELWASADRPDSTATPYGFRCAWGGAS